MIDINLVGNSRLNNITDNNLELLFQEVMLCFTIGKNETFGKQNNIDLQRYVLSKRINKEQIIADVRKLISENCPHAIYYKYDIEVEILQGQNGRSDILYIAFIVETDDKTGINERYVSEFLIGD
jgi:hypothetical protein